MSESHVSMRSERVLLEAHAYTEAKRRHRRLFQLQLEAGGLQLVGYDDRRQMIAGHWRQRLSADQLVWLQEQPGKQLLALTFQRDWLIMRFGSASDFHRWSERLKPLVRPLLSNLLYCSMINVRRGIGEARQLAGKRLLLSLTSCELHLGRDCVTRPDLRLLVVCLRRCQRDGDEVRVLFGTGEMDLQVFNHHEAVILQESLMGAMSGCCGEPDGLAASEASPSEVTAAAAAEACLTDVELGKSRSPKWADLQLQTEPPHRRNPHAQTEDPAAVQLRRPGRSQQNSNPRQRKISAGNYTLGWAEPRDFSVQSDAGLGPRTLSMGNRQQSFGIPLSRIKQAVASAAQHYGHCRRGLRPMTHQPKSLDLWGSIDIEDEAAVGGAAAAAPAHATAPTSAASSAAAAAAASGFEQGKNDFRVRSHSSCSPAEQRQRRGRLTPRGPEASPRPEEKRREFGLLVGRHQIPSESDKSAEQP